LAAARTDPMTEAANRLHLQEDLEGIADRARRYGHHYCAAFCDVDGFKSYNDTFGHLAGDGAIRAVSRTIHQQLRCGDGFYRYGGDEFLVLLPEQSLAGAGECLERVRIAVESISDLAGGESIARPLTISVGIAELRSVQDKDPIQSWLEQADKALYRAKARGRNCIEIAE
jgi:two-component system chemotaxis response regulator CheY